MEADVSPVKEQLAQVRRTCINILAFSFLALRIVGNRPLLAALVVLSNHLDFEI